MTTLADAAIHYAESGHFVFPLERRGKKPHAMLPKTGDGDGGFKLATTDVEQVRTWWATDPKANIGLWPGPSGLAVIDIDCPEAEQRAGELGLLAEPTRTVRTGRAGGRHLWFRKPNLPPELLGNVKLTPDNKLELRCQAGYVVAPPSVHPSGSRYEEEDPDAAILDMPHTFLAFLRSKASSNEKVATTTAASQLAGEIIPEGKRDNTLASIAGAMRRKNMSAEAIEAALLVENAARCRPPLPEADIRRIARSISRKTPTETPDVRPTIVIRPKLTAMTDEAIEAIAQRPDLGVYVRGRMLVTVARDGSRRDRWLHRPPGAPVIVPITAPRMLGLLDAVAQWQRWNYRAQAHVPAMPPDRVAAQILGRLEWPLPYLDAVIETPTLRPDGSVLASPGWDQATGLLYEPMPGTEWSAVPDRPSADEVREAVDVLMDPVEDFPFVSRSDRSAYLAAVLTLVARHMVDGPVPLFAIRAPTPGTGKTLLGDVIGLGGTGRAPPAMTMSYETEELRKRITALAVAGTAVVLLDNLSGSLGSDVLAAALTKREWEDRLLGQTEIVTLPLRTVWLATGNNLAFRRTLARRVVPIDLDAKSEQPEDRTDFRHADLLGHVRRVRPQLVTAALTVLRGFHVARRPVHGGARMGSFEAWDDLIRSAVVWAGLEDPAAATDPDAGRGRVRSQADDDTEALATLLAALDRVFPDGTTFTCAAVMSKAQKDDDLLRDLELAAPGKAGRVNVQSLGYALRAATNRPCDGLTLKAEPGKRPRVYAVVR